MVSLCLTNFNRYEMLFESFAQVYDDERISEIIISDDCSDWGVYKRIQDRVQDMPKVKLSRTDTNVGCYRNKRRAVSLASNKGVIIFDSDNIITKEYIDTLWKPCGNSQVAPYKFVERQAYGCCTAFQPVFAKPHFNFTEFEDKEIDKHSVHNYANNTTFCTALNAFNYFINRDEYLRVWDDKMMEPWTADSIYQNYRWLEAGNSIYFCPGLEYEHRVHDGSHYKEHHRKTGNLYNEVVAKLKAMR